MSANQSYQLTVTCMLIACKPNTNSARGPSRKFYSWWGRCFISCGGYVPQISIIGKNYTILKLIFNSCVLLLKRAFVNVWWLISIRDYNTTIPVLYHRSMALLWRHNGRKDVSNHQPHVCLLNHSFRRRSKKTSKLRVTGICAGNSPVTGEFLAQVASNAENVSVWWHYPDVLWMS